MDPKLEPTLNRVAETLLIPLYTRAMESQRPDAIVNDAKAAELVAQMPFDFSRVREIQMPELLKVMRIIFTREFDRYAREFLNRHPEAVIVHIGCGLDTRFQRVDNGKVQWYDLDVPEVVGLRRKFIGDEWPRYHLLACSVLEHAWMDAVNAHASLPFMFLAEAVFVYFREAEVKTLVLALRDRFAGAELVFDGWKPFEIWLANRYLSKSAFGGLMRWGLWRSQEIESWGEEIHLLDEWGFFDQQEPRMHSFRWMAPLFRFFKPMCIYRFRLGEAAG